MHIRPKVAVLAILTIFLTLSVLPGEALAQPVLVDAFPPPDATLSSPPLEIVLFFDRALSENIELSVTNDRGERVDNDDLRVLPDNHFAMRVTLSAQPNGLYTVNYRVRSLGGSTYIAGSYQFGILLPPPRLHITSPPDGAALDTNPFMLEMQVEAVDFSNYDSRIHVYVDNQKVTELRELSYQIEALTPGVHEINVVLAQFDSELPDTTQTIHLAIINPDEEVIGREAAAILPPVDGLELEPPQLAGVILGILFLLGLGIIMGYFQEQHEKVN